MNRRKKDIIILAVLIPVLFIVLFSGWNKKGRKNVFIEEPEIVQNGNNTSDIPASIKIENIFQEQVAREKEYLEKGFSRNPFAQFEIEAKKETKSITINVSGIFDDGSNDANTHAIINGRILSKGESYRGFVIEKISTDEITMRKGEQVYKIKVGVPVKIEIP